ncbi:MAG: helix-turn-helix domain-containing protein [Acidobacteria bacterium]|nr:helix-turn-helix domain-containing protein [Acidobacteriota bacterium]
MIQNAVQDSGGVQAEAARRLGISRSDIAYKIKKYRLQ